MAFDRTLNKFERMAGGNHQLFYYITTEAIATVAGSGYFNLATGEIRQGDIIMVIGTSGGTATIDFLFVTSLTGAATVTTSGTEGITATTAAMEQQEDIYRQAGTGEDGQARVQALPKDEEELKIEPPIEFDRSSPEHLTAEQRKEQQERDSERIRAAEDSLGIKQDERAKREGEEHRKEVEARTRDKDDEDDDDKSSAKKAAEAKAEAGGTVDRPSRTTRDNSERDNPNKK